MTPEWDDVAVQYAKASSKEFEDLEFGTKSRGFGKYATNKRLALNNFYKASAKETNKDTNVTEKKFAVEVISGSGGVIENTVKAGYAKPSLAGTQAVVWMGVKRGWARAGVDAKKKNTYGAALESIIDDRKKASK